MCSKSPCVKFFQSCDVLTLGGWRGNCMFLILTICHVHSAVPQGEGRVSEYGGECICGGHDMKILIYFNALIISMTVLCVSFSFPAHAELWISYWFYLRVVAFPTIRWLYRTSAATWGCARERSQHGPDRGSPTSGSCSDWEPFTCFHWSGKRVTTANCFFPFPSSSKK